ncbi:unnamed protein product [Polarella glacialis]|uniref:Uncharacterized protein n=1 Tax=Polarella glacialis TaxID=89957 RepID=A0A813EJV6_POLGL|nr:unnamed protein product [Polarella glacialis]
MKLRAPYFFSQATQGSCLAFVDLVLAPELLRLLHHAVFLRLQQAAYIVVNVDPALILEHVYCTSAPSVVAIHVKTVKDHLQHLLQQLDGVVGSCSQAQRSVRPTLLSLMLPPISMVFYPNCIAATEHI